MSMPDIFYHYYAYNLSDLPPADDELVGYSAFIPYEPNQHFLDIITVSAGSIKADVYLTYQW